MTSHPIAGGASPIAARDGPTFPGMAPTPIQISVFETIRAMMPTARCTVIIRSISIDGVLGNVLARDFRSSEAGAVAGPTETVRFPVSAEPSPLVAPGDTFRLISDGAYVVRATSVERTGGITCIAFEPNYA